MILTTGQYQRLVELLWALYDFAAVRLDLTDELYPDGAFEPDPEVQASLMKYVWDEDRSTIDDFARENPADLPAADVQELRRWGQGLYGTFSVVRDGLGQSVLLGEGMGFVVTGINAEPWEVVSAEPAFVRTALIPFGDKITYAGVLVEPRIAVSDDMGELLRSELARRRATGGLVSDARTFVRAVRELRYGTWGHAEALGARAASQSPAGAGAPLSAVLPRPSEPVLAGVRGMPAGQHRGALAGLVGRARERACRLHRLGLHAPGSPLGPHAAAPERTVAVQPVEFAEELLRLRGVARLAEVSRECVAYFARNGIEGPRPHEASQVSNELLARWRSFPDGVNYEVVDAPDGCYLVEYTLAKDNWYELTGAWHPDDSDRDDGYPGSELAAGLRSLLEGRRHLPPRPVPDDLFDHLTDFFGWSLDQPPMRALTRYLDAHVPDGEDDYAYANDVLGFVQECLHVGMGVDEIVWELFDRGACPDERSFDAMEWLVCQVVDGMPSWACNGWSPREARELAGREGGRE